MLEKGHVLRILEDTKKAIQKRDAIKLKELSDQTLHAASTSQDAESIAVAVIVYSLSKIIERKCPGEDIFCRKVTVGLEDSITSLKKNDEDRFRKSMSSLRVIIGKLAKNVKQNIQDVFRKASINKASKLYEHGISMEKTAGLLGVTMFELANYAGQKEVTEMPLGKTLGARARIKLAEDMFL